MHASQQSMAAAPSTKSDPDTITARLAARAGLSAFNPRPSLALGRVGSRSSVASPPTLSNFARSHQALRQSLVGGQPLPGPARERFDRLFGFDFSRVRIHADAQARDRTQELGARGYTRKNDIVINPRYFSSAASPGDRLLGHELAHVVQQARAASGAGRNTIGDPSDRFEQEAHMAAASVARGGTFQVREVSGVPAVQFDLEDMSLTERLAIAVVAGLPSLGDGFRVALTALLLFIGGIIIIYAVVSALFPGVGQVISAALATTAAAWFIGFLVSLGLAHALTTLTTAGGALLRECAVATNRQDLEAAGRRWGMVSGPAIVELLSALIAIPAIRAMQRAPQITGYRPPRPGRTSTTAEPAPAPAAGAPAAVPVSRVLSRIQSARGRLTQILTRLLRTGPNESGAFVIDEFRTADEPFGISGINVWRSGNELRVMDEFINVPESFRGQGFGTALRAVMEQAAVDAARQAGATQARVMVRSIINQRWAARLLELGYQEGFIEPISPEGLVPIRVLQKILPVS